MLKLLQILARGNAARATEDLYDRNALLILDQQIRETRAALERSRRALALAIAGDQSEALRHAEIDARSTDLETRVIAALSGGRDDLAGEAADVLAELEAERGAIEAARARFAAEIARLRGTVSDATRRQAELERGRRVAGAAEAARRLSARTGRCDTATLSEAEATLARLRRLQAEADDTEAALADLDGADIAARLEREGFGARGRPTGGDVLERLRRKAGLTPAA